MHPGRGRAKGSCKDGTRPMDDGHEAHGLALTEIHNCKPNCPTSPSVEGPAWGGIALAAWESLVGL